MNKYYTPTIEEFHVGFEYEALVDYYQQEFEKFTIDDTDSLRSICSTWDRGEDEYLRVKFLDREDIESLGWKVSKQHNGDYNIENFTTYENATHYMVVYNQGGKRAWFCVHRKEVDGDYGELIAEFRVAIKNKSELKKILKQLHI